MKILVLNGSPKGDQSVTMQYVQYLAKSHPEREFLVRNMAHRIRSLERHPEQFAELIAEVRQADLVLWTFPLYILLVCSQYKRFIELIAERFARRRAGQNRQRTEEVSERGNGCLLSAAAQRRC